MGLKVKQGSLCFPVLSDSPSKPKAHLLIKQQPVCFPRLGFMLMTEKNRKPKAFTAFPFFCQLVSMEISFPLPFVWALPTSAIVFARPFSLLETFRTNSPKCFCLLMCIKKTTQFSVGLFLSNSMAGIFKLFKPQIISAS